MPEEIVEPLYSHERGPGRPATPEEVIDSWTGLQGCVTISGQDFCSVRQIGYKRFDPITEADLIRNLAWYGTFDEVLKIHVSRRIPVGYYYHGPNVPDLLPIQIPEGASRVIRREIPPDVLMEIRSRLKPFSLILK